MTYAAGGVVSTAKGARKAKGKPTYPVLPRASANIKLLVGVMARVAIERYGDN
jgi:hypothetical protein